MVICHIFINLSHVMVMVFRILGIKSDDDMDLQCIDQQRIAGDEHPEDTSTVWGWRIEKLPNDVYRHFSVEYVNGRKKIEGSA